MSRSGYDDGCEVTESEANLWQANLDRALTGKRGQQFLRRLIQALDAMPTKELFDIYTDDDGLFDEDKLCRPCAIGAIALREDWENPTRVDAADHESLGDRLDIAPMLVAQVEYENDHGGPQWHSSEEPAQRWARIRAWAAGHLREEQR